MNRHRGAFIVTALSVHSKLLIFESQFCVGLGISVGRFPGLENWNNGKKYIYIYVYIVSYIKFWIEALGVRKQNPANITKRLTRDLF